MDSLKILDLRDNHLYELNNDMFSDLEELRELYLQQNKIEELPEGVFDSLSNLQILNMGLNRIKKLPRRIFANLMTLQQLDLSYNKIKELPVEIFHGTVLLSHLELSGNSIQTLQENIFEEVANLQTFQVSSCLYSSLHLYTFIWSNIFLINILGKKQKPKKKKYLFIINITFLPARRLQSNKIAHISRDSFKNLKRLRNLHLSNNNISFIPDGLLRNCPKLKTLELGDNYLTAIPDPISSNLSSILILDMSRNKIDQIPERLLGNLNRLKLLSLPQNNISSISSQTFSNLTDLQYLLLNDNRLTHIPNRAFKSLQKLKVLMLSENKIELIGSKAFVLSNSKTNFFNLFFRYLIRTAMKAVHLESFEGIEGLSTKMQVLKTILNAQLAEKKNKTKTLRHEDYFNIFKALTYIEFEDIDEDMKGVLRRVLEQSGFAQWSQDSSKFLPCPAGTFVKSADKGSTSCSECPPGGFFSDTLAYVSDQCKRCPNGTFVSLDKKPGRRALDCVACPQGTDTNSFAGFRACKCLQGFYRTHLFKGCKACQKEGFLCLDDYVTLKPGFWWRWYNDVYKGMYQNFTLNLRSSKPSIENNEVEYSFDLPLAYECPRKESCLGGLDSTCKQGYEGPLCEVCSPGYHKRLQTCKKCPSKSWMGAQLAITIALLLILVVVIVWTSVKKNRQSNNQRPLVDIILARLKIIIGFYQVTFGLLDAFSFISWPDSLSVIARYSEILQFNVLQMAPMHCLLPQLKIDAFGSLFAILAINIGAIV
ncbi:unnamed protein product [Pocillopora meandrina]|uniref:DUF7630 domain-containing protein n=1 Tax=Pocillopora meandrina TaxID=46732 RepID=A0AAU9VKU8_9CNID|nr:unnamed protein product [Pocillopora meandrina]